MFTTPTLTVIPTATHETSATGTVRRLPRNGGSVPCYAFPVTEADHLSRCHPFLRERVARLLDRWRTLADVGDSIRVAESVRSLGVQQRYYARGATRAD